jgi:hypothetical protein
MALGSMLSVPNQQLLSTLLWSTCTHTPTSTSTIGYDGHQWDNRLRRTILYLVPLHSIQSVLNALKIHIRNPLNTTSIRTDPVRILIARTFYHSASLGIQSPPPIGPYSQYKAKFLIGVSRNVTLCITGAFSDLIFRS